MPFFPRSLHLPTHRSSTFLTQQIKVIRLGSIQRGRPFERRKSQLLRKKTSRWRSWTTSKSRVGTNARDSDGSLFFLPSELPPSPPPLRRTRSRERSQVSYGDEALLMRQTGRGIKRPPGEGGGWSRRRQWGREIDFLEVKRLYVLMIFRGWSSDDRWRCCSWSFCLPSEYR